MQLFFKSYFAFRDKTQGIFIANRFLRLYIPHMTFSDSNNYADVVFPGSSIKKLTYRVPEHFDESCAPGCRVIVPLGSRKQTGYIVNFVPIPGIENLRDIEDLPDPYPLLTPEMLQLTRWVAEYYLASWGEVIRCALPPGLDRKTRLNVYSKETMVDPSSQLTELQELILNSIREKEKTTLRSLEKEFGKSSIRFTLSKLEKAELIRTEQLFEKQQVRIQWEKWITLIKPPDSEEMETLKRRAPKQAAILKTIQKLSGEICRSELDTDYAVLKNLKKKGWIAIREKEKFREAYPEIQNSARPVLTLTEDQKRVLRTIESALQGSIFQVFLLHGVTASGKTQIYIEAIQNVIKRGKTALVLIPEISLTPQAVQRYRNVFGDNVAVLHSRMSAGERYDSWRKLREGKFKIGLGPRSAVFAPLENLGIIVVDEEHENSYKQADPSPRYHARDVAVMRGKINNCPVILGSATPSVESYFNAAAGKYALCKLPFRIDDVPMPKVTLVNLKELRQENKKTIFSPHLIDHINRRLEKNEQVILLQNRRGYSSFLRCNSCGHIENCKHCDITLTYHQNDLVLRCHYCGFQKRPPDTCSKCGGNTFAYRGVGTQRIEEELKTLFPKARCIRMDLDTTRRKGAHSRIIFDFEKGKGDILFGTQMVAKGLDFPGVSLVGVISADTGLFFPDFRAGEKTFQLLTQAAGRAGRRKEQGEVIIQTDSPEHSVLKFSMNHNYEALYQWIIQEREELCYPPFGKMVIVRFKGKNKNEVARTSRLFADTLPNEEGMTCLGPIPAPLPKIKGLFRYQLILRSENRKDPGGKRIRNCIRTALLQFYEKNDFRNVRLAIDVDPVDML